MAILMTSKLKLLAIVSWSLGIILLFVMIVSSLYIYPSTLAHSGLAAYPLFKPGRKGRDTSISTLVLESSAPADTSESTHPEIYVPPAHQATHQRFEPRDRIEPGIELESKSTFAIMERNNSGAGNRTYSTHIYSELDCEKGMPDSDALWQRLVIVTAFSENHAREGMWMIASAQKQMPNKRIVVYDLGVAKKTWLQLTALCETEIRLFDFKKYPKHVEDLHNFAWKIIIIKETLFEFGAIFYGDSSIRFQTSLRELFPYLHLHHGFMFHVLSYDAKAPGDAQKPLLNMTHRTMFRELGVDLLGYRNSYNVTPHIHAGRLLLVNNSIINKKVISPLLNCGLRNQCIYPEGATRRDHHFDQSAISILLYKNMREEWTYGNRVNSTNQFDEVTNVVRTGKKPISSGFVCTNTIVKDILGKT